MKSDTMKPPNCSGHMLCRTEFLGPRCHVLFLAVGCMYKYPLPTLLMGFCSRTHTHMYTQYTGAVRCGGLVAAVLLLRGSKHCRAAGVHMGRAEEPDLQRDPPLYHPGQPAAEYTVVVQGRGLSAVAMGSLVIEPPPPPPHSENRCIKGHQRRGN